ELQSQNLISLSSYLVQVGTHKTAIGNFTINIVAGDIGPAGLNVSLLDKDGKNLGGRDVIPATVTAMMAMQGFVLPEEGQAGWPVVISGAFNGDSKDTEVEIGGKQRRVIAESPRHATVDAPEDQTGSSNITVKEPGKTATGTYRNARVKLRA